MKCTSCNKELIDGTEFCPYCGVKKQAPVSVKTKFCPECCQQVLVDTETCECGYKFVEILKPTEKPEINQESGCWATFSKLSKIFGSISMAIFWIPIIGLFCLEISVPGIVFGALGKRSKKEYAKEDAKLGFKRCLFATIFSIVITYTLLIILEISSY